MNTMNSAITTAIQLLAEKITESVKPDDAMKLTQAALNLAHAKATLDNLNR